jgi:hypothetical protein
MSTTTMDRAVRTGVVLPNGWTVVDTYEDWSQAQFGDEREQGIVLAMMPGEYDKFATWSYVVDDRGIVTVSGHYFSHIFPAARDFGRRAGRPMPTEESE